MAAIREVPPVVFVQWDYGNVDYQKANPEWPPAGGMVSFRWSDVYQSWDMQDWSPIDRYILQARGYTVTLTDGTVIPKPVAFGVDVATMDDYGTLHFPAFVIDECGPDLTYTYTPGGDCPAYTVPNYSNTCWQRYWLGTVAAMGAHYDSNPAFSNLEWVKMSLGWDEEAVPWKAMGGGCDYTGGPSAGFDNWVRSTIQAYNAAFPHLVNVAQMMVHATQPYADWMATLNAKLPQLMATFSDKTTGIKLNGWTYDVEGARIYYGLADPLLVGGVFGYGERWHGTLPVATSRRAGGRAGTGNG